jgi:hypothetical protein
MVLNNFLEGGTENRFRKAEHRRFMLAFIAFNLLLIAYSLFSPLGDFGNYYYGSKFFVSGIEPLKLYEDLHYFNTLIRQYESGPFFENYTPVPPFSLLFYIPFLAFKCSWAKLVFNLLSLVLLSFSLQRAIKHVGFINYWFYLLPLIFFQPLLSNYQQGQAYLLVAALLLDLFVSWQSRQAIRSGLILALLFSIKIFPAFIGIIFLLKKDWKPVAWSALFSLLLAGVTYVAVGQSTCLFYYSHILPKLAINEITSPFSFSNQSLHGFLMHAFIYDPHHNPLPFIVSPLTAALLETLFYAIVFTVLLAARKEKPALFFMVCLLSLMLINKYTTLYGLLILFPVLYASGKLQPTPFLWTLFLLALACNIPAHRPDAFPLVLQYARFWLLLLAWLLLISRLNIAWRWSYALVGLLLFAVPSFVFYKYTGGKEIRIYPSAGVLYEVSVGKNGLMLYSCLGDRDTVELWPVSIYQVDSTKLNLKHSDLQKEGHTVYPDLGRIKKAMLVNRHYLIALSDKNNGAGMYHLLIKDLGE